LKFIRAGRIDKIPAISDALFALNNPTVDLYKELVGAAGVTELIRDSSYLYVYRKLEAADPDGFFWRLRREHGARMDFLRDGEVQEVSRLQAAFSSAVMGRVTMMLERTGSVRARTGLSRRSVEYPFVAITT